MILLCIGLLAGAASAAPTTSVDISRIAADGTTVLANETVSFAWMKANLNITGDGETHYGHQGPVFEGDPWDQNQTINTDDAGALRGTSVLDLAELVGGIPENSTVKIIAKDGFSRTFSSSYIISPESRMGPLVLVWEVNDVNVSAAGSSGDASDGMRIYFFADDHVFGNYDMLQTMPESDRYNYSNTPSTSYPSTRGLSVQYVDRIRICTDETAYVPNEPVDLTITGPTVLTSGVNTPYTFQHPNATSVSVDFGDGRTRIFTASEGKATAYHTFSADEPSDFIIRGTAFNSSGKIIKTETFSVRVDPKKPAPSDPYLNETLNMSMSNGNVTRIAQVTVDLSDIITGSIPQLLAEDTTLTISGDPVYAQLPEHRGIISVLNISLTNLTDPDSLSHTASLRILLNNTAVNSVTDDDPRRVTAFRNTLTDSFWVQVPLKTEYNQTADTSTEYAYDVETPGFSYFTFASAPAESPIQSPPANPNPTPISTITPTPTPTPRITALEVNLYASDRSTLLLKGTYTLEEIIALGNIGDGVTHIYLQGPVFAGDQDPSKYWDPTESINVLEKDMGAVRGTTVKTLAQIVGGIPPGSSVQIVSTDGWRKTFSSSYIIDPPSRMGAMFLAWEKNGVKVSEGYNDG
ncbi:MAG: hypothetical protein PHF90_06540, partial [Methanocorpusculum sp.]|nr:hypothetical protein [Methanocorpusculum sp.]